MDIFEKTRQLESQIARRVTTVVKNLAQGDGIREPIELTQAILDAVEREIQSGGRGTRVFPFNTIDVSILAPSDHARARMEAIMDGDVPLRDRITERLHATGCARNDLLVRVNYLPRTQKHWLDSQFTIAFSRNVREGAEAPVPETAVARLEMTVVRGTAERRTYLFASHRIDLGRGLEVRDSRNGLMRTNHVAFSESDEVSRSISRQHSHVVYDPQSGGFRVHDDGSVHGTTILRKGRTVAVSRGPRGVRLQSGDEIVLGAARVRVKFDHAARR